jgi:hypothetical protein
MSRGRKPIGERAMTNAERQQRWRDQHRSNQREDCELATSFRLRMFLAVEKWLNRNACPASIVDTALDDLAQLYRLAQGASPERKQELKRRYLANWTLDDEAHERKMERIWELAKSSTR